MRCLGQRLALFVKKPTIRKGRAFKATLALIDEEVAGFGEFDHLARRA